MSRDEAANWAARLLDTFGSLPEVLAASPSELRRALPDVDRLHAFIAALGATMGELLLRRVQKRYRFDTAGALLDYLWFDQGHHVTERFRVLYVSGANELIRDVTFAVGAVDAATVPVREVIRIAIEVGAASVLLIHNHPSGDTTPSPADLRLTHQMIGAARLFDLNVADHIIVGRWGWTSLRSLGHLGPAATASDLPEPLGPPT